MRVALRSTAQRLGSAAQHGTSMGAPGLAWHVMQCECPCTAQRSKHTQQHGHVGTGQPTLHAVRAALHSTAQRSGDMREPKRMRFAACR